MSALTDNIWARMKVDETSKPLTAGTAYANKYVVLDSSKAISGIVIKNGTSAVPLTLVSGNGMQSYYSTTATSGDIRGTYGKLTFTAAGASGEAARFYTSVNNVTVANAGTVNGAHISLQVTGAAGKISGEANALRTTLDFDTTPTTVGGTCAVQMIETNIAAGPTIPAGTCFARYINSSTQKIDYLFSIENPSTTMFATASSTTIGKKLKIRVDGTDYFIALTAAV